MPVNLGNLLTPAPSIVQNAEQTAQNLQKIIANKQAITRNMILNKLLPQIQKATLKKLQLTGTIAPELAGVMQYAKEANLTPEQTAQLVNLVGMKFQPKSGIQVGVGPQGTQVSIGGPQQVRQTSLASSLSSLYGGQVIPNTGQTSRGTQGAAKVDPVTGQITSIPTRSTSGFLQQGQVGTQRFKDAVETYQQGMAPYSGLEGYLNFGRDLLAKQFGDQKASKRIDNYMAAIPLKPLLANDLDRISAGTVTDAGVQSAQQALNPAWYETENLFNKRLNSLKKTADLWAKTGATALTQGIDVNQLSPEQLKDLQSMQQAGTNNLTPLAQSFLPHEQLHLNLEALKTPQKIVNGQPAIKQPHPENVIKKATVIKRIRIQLPDGRIGTIPEDKLNEAIKRGAKRLS